MPINQNSLGSLEKFSEEEQALFSELLNLRKVNNIEFRKRFKDLNEDQGRFLDYKEIIESRTKKPTPVLNGFYVSKSETHKQSPIKTSNGSKNQRRRCCLQ